MCHMLFGMVFKLYFWGLGVIVVGGIRGITCEQLERWPLLTKSLRAKVFISSIPVINANIQIIIVTLRVIIPTLPSNLLQSTLILDLTIFLHENP